jgi:hypothetical protein
VILPQPLEIPKDIDVHRLQPGAPLTRLDKRAIRTAWLPAVAQTLLAPALITGGVLSASTFVLIAGMAISVIALTLLPAQARGCRKLSAWRIIRADLYTVSGIMPYPEYRRWVASLPAPGPVWRALGAPTPQERLHILRERHAHT